MKAQGLAAFGLVVAGLAAVAGEGGHQAHWSYAGNEGPEHWGALEPGYATCSAGKDQSPIDLAHFIEADLPPLTFDYRPGGASLVNNGHAVQVDYAPGSSLSVDGKSFELKQFHFHAPSEHTVGGKSYPMEVHFVHADAQGNLAVVGVLVEDGAANRLLGLLGAHAPARAGDKVQQSPPIDATDLLPADRDYYRYSGSLTTPPCSEGVRWLVLKAPIDAAPAEIAAIAKAIGHPNNRPVMPVGARPVLE